MLEGIEQAHGASRELARAVIKLHTGRVGRSRQVGLGPWDPEADFVYDLGNLVGLVSSRVQSKAARGGVHLTWQPIAEMPGPAPDGAVYREPIELAGRASSGLISASMEVSRLRDVRREPGMPWDPEADFIMDLSYLANLVFSRVAGEGLRRGMRL